MNKQTLSTVYWSLVSVLVLLVLLAAGNDGPMEVSELMVLLMVSVVAVSTTVMILLLIMRQGRSK
jgi:hypothetical protein